ncbi:MAG: polysaccharide biosynthesis C-terminal domain-containing protein, partial [Clostridia bacterium]|nr:polysaccharide biosynthesis C-terminal domain-containing protein [Clostridia bacterium]
VLAPACMFVGLLSITNAILQSHGYERKPIISMLIGSAVKLGASVILVSRPNIGIYGAPIGTFLCYFTIAVCDFYFLKKYAGVSLKVLGGIVKPMIGGIGAGASARLVYQLLLDYLPGRLCTVAGILAAVIVYIVLILFLRGFTKDELELIPRGEKVYNIMHRLKLM